MGFSVAKETRVGIEALEALPVDSLWTGGHLASPNPGTEAMGNLVRIGALTERVRVGTSILLLPLYPPAIVAKQIADLDRLTGGRVILGVGVGGEYPQEFRAAQVPITERGRRTDEAIPLLRDLWSGEAVSHAGRFYSMEDVRIHPPPRQAGGPPIVVAGRKPAAIRRAALLGDGWMPYLYSAQQYARSVDEIKALATEAGRNLDGFEWCAFLFVNVHHDREIARRSAARYLGATYRQDFGDFVQNVAVVGTPAEAAARIQAYVDAGARHLIFSTATTEDPWPIRHSLLEEVLPQVAVPGEPVGVRAPAPR